MLAEGEGTRRAATVHGVGRLDQFAVVVVAARLPGATDRRAARLDATQGAPMEGVALAIDDVALKVGREAATIELRLVLVARTTEDGGGEVVRVRLALEPALTKVLLPFALGAILALPLMLEVPRQRHGTRPNRRRVDKLAQRLR